jgi:23S rRNA (guanosine2251-2'-O)-methyltransferase
MRKLHHYSIDKFQGMDEAKQIKAILQLLSVLEKNLAEPEFAPALISSVLQCLSWSRPAVAQQFYTLNQLTAASSAHEIIKLVTPLLRDLKPNYDESDIEILRYDGEANPAAINVPYPLTVVLDNLRSAYNVGSIFRTAECVQAAKLCLCGITPCPPHPKVVRTAMGTEERLLWSYYTHTSEAIRQLQKFGMPVLALETSVKARSLFDYSPVRPCALILGNEALGIEDEILNQADEILSIPTHGWKNSLNVSNAFALAAYHLSGITST